MAFVRYAHLMALYGILWQFFSFAIYCHSAISDCACHSGLKARMSFIAIQCHSAMLKEKRSLALCVDILSSEGGPSPTLSMGDLGGNVNTLPFFLSSSDDTKKKELFCEAEPSLPFQREI